MLEMSYTSIYPHFHISALEAQVLNSISAPLTSNTRHNLSSNLSHMNHTTLKMSIMSISVNC